MQGRFGNQRIVILLSESSCALQRTCQDTHCLELRSAVADTIFVNSESLYKVFVSHFLEPALVSNLPTGNEETEAELGGGWIDAGVELNECLVEEAIEAR